METSFFRLTTVLSCNVAPLYTDNATATQTHTETSSNVRYFFGEKGCKSCIIWKEAGGIIELQNNSGWKGHQKVTNPNVLLKSGQIRLTCSGPCSSWRYEYLQSWNFQI